MSDDDSVFDDAEIDVIFGNIVATEFGAIAEAVDVVDVHLMDGTIFRFHGLDPVTLTTALATAGMAVLSDDFGKTAVLLAHGVAAIIGSPE